MGKRGPKPKAKVKIEWSSDFAYAVGLIVTDGNLSQIGSRISFVSKDLEQIKNFKRCLGLKNKIGLHHSGSTEDDSYRIQFRDVLFFEFLNSIGIFPKKSKIIGAIIIPRTYFFDYLRGCFDGDGTVYSYWDKRWKSSFMFYLSFVSASRRHIDWLQNKLAGYLGVKGHITKDGKGSTFQLKYAKAESLMIMKKMYENNSATHLSRKKLKISKILSIVGESLNKQR